MVRTMKDKSYSKSLDPRTLATKVLSLPKCPTYNKTYTVYAGLKAKPNQEFVDAGNCAGTISLLCS